MSDDGKPWPPRAPALAPSTPLPDTWHLERARHNILRATRSECDELLNELRREHDGDEAAALRAFADIALKAAKNVKVVVAFGEAGRRAHVAKLEADGRRIVREPDRTREDEIREQAQHRVHGFVDDMQRGQAVRSGLAEHDVYDRVRRGPLLESKHDRREREAAAQRLRDRGVTWESRADVLGPDTSQEQEP